MIVVDASVLCDALIEDNEEGDLARARLSGEQLAAPEIVYIEVTSAIRRILGTGKLDDRRAAMAITDLRALPLERADHHRLLPRIWELRHNLTPYDASYVALAELIGTPLLTNDKRLANSPGVLCDFEVLAA